MVRIFYNVYTATLNLRELQAVGVKIYGLKITIIFLIKIIAIKLYIYGSCTSEQLHLVIHNWSESTLIYMC